MNEDKKIVIVMTYYDRFHLLRQTLEHIDALNIPNMEIVIVDDGSPVSDINPVNTAGNRHVIRILPSQKAWVSQPPAQNMGIQKALDLGADILILQNAECRWIGNIADYARKYLTQENYISFACYSLDKETTDRKLDARELCKVIRENNVGASADGQCAWYNHNIYRAVAYDFCSVITRENILKLNGYEESFKDGIGYSDDFFVAQVKRLGLHIDIPNPDLWISAQDEFNYLELTTPFTVHQFHYSGARLHKDELLNKNQDIYNKLGSDGSGRYRAIHEITPDLHGN